jgi:HSP90 family molecular chaperone
MLSSSRLSLRLSRGLPVRARALTPLLSSRASARLQARPALQLLPSAAARPYATSRASPEKTAAFKAETRQLLDIVTNSLYSDKDVFVRELISNSSDACEKLRHLQATNAGGLAERGDGAELEIRIEVDEAAKTITIQDSGVGMTAEELEANLGTIARSGSREFAASADSEMGDIIGKFGVGFYAAFMVGSKVTVVSRSAKEEVRPTK